jgi:hypothetical protein
VSDFKVGYAEKERQNADQRVVLDRKGKTGYTCPVPIVHFSAGIGHFVWDKLAEDEGDWTVPQHQWSIAEANRNITSQDFLHSILSDIRGRAGRAKDIAERYRALGGCQAPFGGNRCRLP